MKKTLSTKRAIFVGAASLAILAGCQNDAPVTQEETVVEETSTAVSAAEFTPKVMAYGRFVPERRDDFAWENDKVAFRVYGPAAPFEGHSSGVDAWFKRVDYSIIDKWYKAHTEGISYHEDKGEGYDKYHTGISRGSGATAIWVDGKPYPAHTYKTYEVIESGGDKVVFNLQYEWETPLGLVAESKTVSLPLGTQLFTVNSSFTLNGEPAKLPIAIGLATHDENASVYSNQEAGHISAWETIDDLGVGTGVVTQADAINEILHVVSEVKDESHIWLLTDTGEDGSLTYHAGFAWEGAGEITTLEQWHAYLDNFSKQD